MYNSVIKSGWMFCKQEEKKVIDSNELMGQKLSSLLEEATYLEESYTEEGFRSGLSEFQETALFTEGSGENGIIKAIPPEPVYEGPSVDELMAQAQEEIAQMKAEAHAVVENEKTSVLEEARNEGYQSGYEQGMQESKKYLQKQEASLKQQEQYLQEKYANLSEELEPLLVETITSIYEHIFHIDLKNKQEILAFLINQTIRSTEGSRDFIIRVAKADYRGVAEQRDIIQEGIPTSMSMELIEDVTLKSGDCLIETGGGIYDCGIDTQLEQLQKQLKILSFEKKNSIE